MSHSRWTWGVNFFLGGDKYPCNIPLCWLVNRDPYLPESTQSSCHLGKLLFPKPELFGDFGENFPTKPPLDAKKGTKNQYGFFRQKNHGPHFKGGGLVFETILNGLSGFQCACVYYCVYNMYTLEVLGHHFLDRLVSEFHHYFSRDLSSSKRKHHF